MKLSDAPTEVIPGAKAWRNHNGFTALLLHYSADPDTAPSEARRLSVPDQQRYLREHELDFSSYAGKPVYAEFKDTLHVDDTIGYIKENPLWVGIDFGYHHPAATFAQIGGPHCWALGEVMGEDMTLEQFLDKLFLPYIERVFGEPRKILYAADPAGRQVTDKSEHTSFSILANKGIYPYARKSEINEGLTIIRQKIALGLLKVHPRCRLLIEAFKGGYRYPEPTQGLPEPQYPAKDGFYEHIADSFRYLAVNSMSLIQRRERPPPPKESMVDRVLRSRVGRHDDEEYGDFA